MRWWGWGEDAHAHALPDRADGMLRRTLGVAGVSRPPVAAAAVRLPCTTLPESVADALRAVVAGDGLRDGDAERLRHAAGRGLPDLLRLRAGRPAGAPDAVLVPRTHEQIAAVLAICARESVAVVPFGGGTSVVGGVEPERGEQRSVVALDLGRLAALHEVDHRSLTARVDGGMRLPELERRLAGGGLTLGHLPQSFEYATVGGCVATRSAGQASTGYGRIEQLVRGVRCVTPTGTLDLAPVPASAAGPSLRELVIGSEGALGVIDRVDLELHHRPPVRHYEGAFLETFAGGLEALRALRQHDGAPEVCRLSDEQETATNLALAGGGTSTLALRALLRARGYAGGCLLILGWEGTETEVARRRARARRLLRSHSPLWVGAAVGRAWERGRYQAPYLRDELLGCGVTVETLETATGWSGLTTLHRRVGEALRDALGERCLVMCHASHVYPTGASLYFTFLAAQPAGLDAQLEQWRAAKGAASQAILSERATITHHHAVGRDHREYLSAEIGERGVGALRALKGELDPRGIMNPGKLLPDRQPAPESR